MACGCKNKKKKATITIRYIGQDDNIIGAVSGYNYGFRQTNSEFYIYEIDFNNTIFERL